MILDYIIVHYKVLFEIEISKLAAILDAILDISALWKGIFLRIRFSHNTTIFIFSNSFPELDIHLKKRSLTLGLNSVHSFGHVH